LPTSYALPPLSAIRRTGRLLIPFDAGEQLGKPR